MLEKARKSLLQSLEKGLMAPVDQLIGKQNFAPTKTINDKYLGHINHSWHNFCVHDVFTVSSVLRELKAKNLWNVNLGEISISEILDRLHFFEDRDIAQLLGFGLFERSECQACSLDPRTKMVKLRKAVLAESNGLCLDCVEREISGSAKECRVKHI
jgi:hypothetical protein